MIWRISYKKPTATELQFPFSKALEEDCLLMGNDACCYSRQRIEPDNERDDGS
jgi:hypothetical protein